VTEPLTPVQIESKLRALVNAITAAQSELRTARLHEVEALNDFEQAKVTAAYSKDCPVVKRGEVTVGERDAWIDAQVLDHAAKLRHASALREIAQDALRSRIAESQAVQSLNASVRQAYAMAGHE
jgi:hypothetical protein